MILPTLSTQSVIPSARAAVDVAKASGKVCVRTPRWERNWVSKVWDVEATTRRGQGTWAINDGSWGSRRSP